MSRKNKKKAVVQVATKQWDPNGKYTPEKATRMITRNGGIINGNGIYSPGAGLRVLGAIDFLTGYCGYHRSVDNA